MPSEVSTYNGDGYDCSHSGGLEVYVKIEDYAALADRVEALEAENARLKARTAVPDTVTLNEKALEAARKAVKSRALFDPVADVSTLADVAVRTYLASQEAGR